MGHRRRQRPRHVLLVFDARRAREPPGVQVPARRVGRKNGARRLVAARTQRAVRHFEAARRADVSVPDAAGVQRSHDARASLGAVQTDAAGDLPGVAVQKGAQRARQEPEAGRDTVAVGLLRDAAGVVQRKPVCEVGHDGARGKFAINPIVYKTLASN